MKLRTSVDASYLPALSKWLLSSYMLKMTNPKLHESALKPSNLPIESEHSGGKYDSVPAYLLYDLLMPQSQILGT